MRNRTNGAAGDRLRETSSTAHRRDPYLTRTAADHAPPRKDAKSWHACRSLSKVRCHRAENAAVELDWSSVRLCGVYLGQKKLLDSGQDRARLSH